MYGYNLKKNPKKQYDFKYKIIGLKKVKSCMKYCRIKNILKNYLSENIRDRKLKDLF